MRAYATVSCCSTRDTTAPPAMTEAIYKLNAGNGLIAKAFANKEGAGHHAPDTLGYDPLLPQFSAAWFKLYVPCSTNHLLSTHALTRARPTSLGHTPLGPNGC